MGEETLQKLVQFFKALADDTRLKTLGLLATQERSVEELAAALGVREPTVSHHLGKLKDMGLVTMRQAGTSHLYRLNAEALHALSKDVFTPETIAAVAQETVQPDAFAQKVLRSFVANGRLVEIPAQLKKRLVILQWLVDHFEPGRRYTEAEVNAVIRRYHDDVATLRREFINNGLMERDNRTLVYWRPQS